MARNIPEIPQIISPIIMESIANKEFTFTLEPTIFGTIKLLSIKCTMINASITKTTCVNEEVAKVRMAIISMEEKIPT
ncbi:hypothetical protein D3C81_1409030 [compost metagenome]